MNNNVTDRFGITAGLTLIHVQYTSRRLGGTKHNVFPQNDVTDNHHFIMTSFRCHICPPKTPVPQLSRNGQFRYKYTVNTLCTAQYIIIHSCISICRACHCVLDTDCNSCTITSDFRCKLLMIRGELKLILGHGVKGKGQLLHYCMPVKPSVHNKHHAQFWPDHFKTSYVYNVLVWKYR